MNLQINFSKSLMMLASLMIVFFFSCTRDFPENVESPDKVVLESIKIVNAGANGDQVIEGVVDEVTKTVTFPRIDTTTNFDAIKFDAVMSNGAKLDKETYAFSFNAGATRNSQIVKVVNNARFREYQVTLRLNIPVFGADFEKPTYYDFSNNPMENAPYPRFVSGLTRGSGFDGEHVLIVSRISVSQTDAHLLKVSDLRNNTINRIPLNVTGIAGGTFSVNVGAQVHGHTYISNLSGNSGASPLKIYYWGTDPASVPQLIFNGTIPGGGARLGDNMSANIDADGNGYLYFGDNAGTRVGRIKITNFSTASDPVSFAGATGQSMMMGFNRVGNTSDYIYTGFDSPIRLANENAVVSYSLSDAAVPKLGTDAHVISFNQERYLIMTTAFRSNPGSSALFVYDITNGSTTAEALALFNEREDKTALFTHSLGGSQGGNAFAQTRWHITKDADGNDQTLTLYSAHNDAGFVIIDFPIKSQED